MTAESESYLSLVFDMEELSPDKTTEIGNLRVFQGQYIDSSMYNYKNL